MESAVSEEELLIRVQSLVSDKLQVVSYKWLSRNFSLSSNEAKRLLQIFATQNEKLGIEIVYAISGWTKEEPHSYAIQLVPKIKLEEAKSALKEPSSVHVYSVQRCLPKDPAQLWSDDFVQAEQLFNETEDVNNCLRDNRYSAVTCDLVQRLPTKRKSSVTSPPQPQGLGSKGVVSPQPTLPEPKVPVLPQKISRTEVKDGVGGKKITLSSTTPKTIPTETKDSSGPGSGGKRKATASTSGSGGSGALANIWGKAPAKPKEIVSNKVSSATTNPSRGPASADAGILALEEDVSSEDDVPSEPPASKMRHVSNSGGRRRRMIVEDDDSGPEDDEMETIIRLGSPDPPQITKSSVAANAVKGGTPSVLQNKLASKEAIVKVNGQQSMPEQESVSKDITNTVKVQNEETHPIAEALNGSRYGSKRKKVLKTRIDERGREVSEVVWETDGDENQHVEKDFAVKPSAVSSKQIDVKPPPLNERPEVVQKQPAIPTKSLTNKASLKSSSKGSSKPTKGQGNIMSFFKKT